MVIDQKTAAETSGIERVDASPSKPVTFAAVGTMGSSEIDVLVVDLDDGTNPLYDADGVAVVMTATSAPLSFYAPIWLQFDKPVTTANAGVQKY